MVETIDQHKSQTKFSKTFIPLVVVQAKQWLVSPVAAKACRYPGCPHQVLHALGDLASLNLSGLTCENFQVLQAVVTTVVLVRLLLIVLVTGTTM